MEKDPSPLDTLRQLKEWLDAGTITPQEFDTLKKKLLFNEAETAAHKMPPGPEPTANSEAAVLLPPIKDPVLPPAARIPEPPPREPAPLHFSSPAPAEESSPPPATFFRNEETEPLYTTATGRSPLATVLIIGGVIALLALVAYLMMGKRGSERLTSTSQIAADTVGVRPEVGPQAEQIELPPPAAPETVRIVPELPPPTAPSPPDSATMPATTPAPLPAPQPSAVEPAATDEAAVRTRVQQALTAYYDDLKAAPFNASQHFAPSVERFYTLQNTTPAAINEDVAKSHFPEFTEEETRIAPGSLKIGPETEDGTRMITYVEKSKAFRPSRQQHQQTTAQVRARFDRNYKLVYLRQERLLENTFSD